MILNEAPTFLADPLDQLLAATPTRYRVRIRTLLTNPRCGGRGLTTWLSLLETDCCSLPDCLPDKLVEVYLRDDEAEPLHDCERCGLAVPVRVARRCGHEAAAEREYFPTCPRCGGRTGRHAYWSRQCGAVAT